MPSSKVPWTVLGLVLLTFSKDLKLLKRLTIKKPAPLRGQAILYSGSKSRFKLIRRQLLHMAFPMPWKLLHIQFAHVLHSGRAKFVIVPACFFPTFIGKLNAVWQGSIGKRRGRGIWHSARHIGHAVVNNTINHKSWVFMRSGLAGFNAPALVHSYVHKYSSLAHHFQHIAGNEVREL